MSSIPHLFTPLTLAGITFPSRIFVSPMCQYSSVDGFANDWHLVNLGSRAVGGAALAITEAAAVLPEGRISPQDLGIWKDEHVPELRRIANFLHAQGTRAGVQLAHAGRKASTSVPWLGDGLVSPANGGWTNVFGPSAIPFAPHYPLPQALDGDGIARVTEAFRRAATRALNAGFDVVEVHAAHGYLLNEFLSPLSNRRGDGHGGSFDNRTRLLLEVVDAIREVWPLELPLLVRISASDWAEGGWDLPQSVELARLLKGRGVDMIDVSSGGLVPGVAIPVGPGYQTPFAAQIRREAQIPAGAVGMITDAEQAEQILSTGQADAVLLAREFLRDPYWPLHAAQKLDYSASWPKQYLRAASRENPARQPIAAAEQGV
ncbi:MAG TPA: NADH:flavin oxidoreductase/NADH oxidase [Acidisarcina sp.]